MPAVIGTSPQPWKLGLRSAPKTPRGHGKCPSTLFKEFWQLAGTHFTMAWARSHGESGCPRLCGIASGNQVPQAVALVTVGLVAGTELAAVISAANAARICSKLTGGMLYQ